MSDYYRGSGSYVDAAKEQLKSLEVAADKRAIRKMNSDLRHDIQATTDVIQANTNAIQEMSMGIRSDIRESTYAIVASQAMLAQTFNHGFNALNNTLEFGFGMVGNRIDAMADRICSKLDEIHDIVNNPIRTQSRELFRRALNSYNRGYYEEALEDCKAAVEKDKTDFISWDLLGHIYLFGAGKFSNVIDIDNAEKAFYNAAKYIDSDIGNSDAANVLSSEIYYYLGYARLIKSNDLLVEKKKKDSIKKLEEAEKASGESYRLSDKNLAALYEQAKELHFLDNDSEAMRLIEMLIRMDKNFALRASTDKNFESLWNNIEAVIEKIKNELCQAYWKDVKKTIKEIETEVAEDKADNGDFEKYYAEPVSNAIKKFVTKCKNLEIEKLDYFSVLDMQAQLHNDLRTLKENVEKIVANIDHERQEEQRRKEEQEHRKWEAERAAERAARNKYNTRTEIWCKIIGTIIGIIIGVGVALATIFMSSDGMAILIYILFGSITFAVGRKLGMLGDEYTIIGGIVKGVIFSFVYLLLCVFFITKLSEHFATVMLVVGPAISGGFLGYNVGDNIHTQHFYKS
ncbi:MAG: hypothetical protein J6X95_06820 [Treponema sp.]|nr:hypothetical protein [Treponema sp.]